MLISFNFSYSEKFFVVFYLSFYFVLGQGPSARDKTSSSLANSLKLAGTGPLHRTMLKRTRLHKGWQVFEVTLRTEVCG